MQARIPRSCCGFRRCAAGFFVRGAIRLAADCGGDAGIVSRGAAPPQSSAAIGGAARIAFAEAAFNGNAPSQRELHEATPHPCKIKGARGELQQVIVYPGMARPCRAIVSRQSNI